MPDLSGFNFKSVRSRLNVFVSVGDGNIISGIHKGFKDLLALGWWEQMPRIFACRLKAGGYRQRLPRPY
jgi:threonine synthase